MNHPGERRSSVVERIATILSTFMAGQTHSMTEMARLTGLPISTAHRMVLELASWQLLERTADGRFRVGIVLRQLGNSTWSWPVLAERGPRVVVDLHEVTHRRARLGILDNGRVSYVEKREGPEPVTSFGTPASLPAHASALGKALLAFSPREVTNTAIRRPLTAFTANTLHTMDALHRNLRAVRLTGFAVVNAELKAGESAIAVPVFGAGGEVVAALELQLEDPITDLEMCRTALSMASRGLSRELVVDGGVWDRPRLRSFADVQR